MYSALSPQTRTTDTEVIGALGETDGDPPAIVLDDRQLGGEAGIALLCRSTDPLGHLAHGVALLELFDELLASRPGLAAAEGADDLVTHLSQRQALANHGIDLIGAGMSIYLTKLLQDNSTLTRHPEI